MLRYQFWWYLLLLGFISACAQQNASTSTAPSAAADSSNLSYESTAADKAYAPSPQSKNQTARGSERLGTQWGDEVNSYVTKVDLRRTSSTPIAETSLRYADKHYSGRTINTISLAAGKVEFSVETDRGNKLPLFRDGSQYYLKGQAGQAYQLVYHNNTNNMYEIVASVDGLDVLDGSRASRSNSGYVLRPKERLVIEGFRKSNSSVASFIFSKPNDAYAANTPSGSIHNMGIIGTVVYELYDPKQTRQRPYRTTEPQAYPADTGYAPAPR